MSKHACNYITSSAVPNEKENSVTRSYEGHYRFVDHENQTRSQGRTRDLPSSSRGTLPNPANLAGGNADGTFRQISFFGIFVTLTEIVTACQNAAFWHARCLSRKPVASSAAYPRYKYARFFFPRREQKPRPQLMR